MLGELGILVLGIVIVTKRRFRMLALSLGLIPMAIAALLLVNEGDFAEQSPDWLLGVIAYVPLVMLAATLIAGASRLAKPASWWARRFYDDEKTARAHERFGT